MRRTRDPISEWFDDGARALLDRVYDHPGEWQRTRLAMPEPRHIAAAAVLGQQLPGRDNASTTRRTGGLQCHTAWARAYVRALYHQHKWYSKPGGGWRPVRALEARHTGGLEVRVSRPLRALGVIPAGQMISARLEPGGAAKVRAVAATPERDTIWQGPGELGPRASDPNLRYWET